MKKLLTVLLFLLAFSVNAQAQLPQCSVSGVLIGPTGAVATNFPITIVRVEKAGSLVTSRSFTVRSHATTGVVTFALPRASTAFLYADIPFFRSRGPGGVPLPIPDASSASLEAITAIAQVPSEGLTLQDEGTTLVNLVGTVNFTGTGVTVTQTAPGIAEVNIIAGSGSIGVRAVDGSPNIGTAVTLEVDESDGLVVSNPSSNVARIDLNSIPVEKIEPLTASRVVVTDGNGFITESSVASTDIQNAIKIRGIDIESSAPTNGTILKYNSSTDRYEVEQDANSGGTVTSVQIAAPAEFMASGGPVTGGGTLTLSWVNQVDNKFLASPADGSSGPIAARLVVDNDIPNTITLDNFNQITTRSASDLNAGTVPVARLPVMVGATSSTNGTAGIVPQPVAGDEDKVLHGDGTFRAVAGGGGGSILVEEADGSPSINDITTIRVDQADGLVLTNPSTPVARIDLSGVPYAVLNLSNSITNSDINSSANIALSKLANGSNIVTSVNSDTNITGSITGNALTLAWANSLSKPRQHASTMYIDQSNTFSTGDQSFAAASSFIVPLAGGANPTANGSFAYDTTAHTLEFGSNGTNRIVAIRDNRTATATDYTATAADVRVSFTDTSTARTGTLPVGSTMRAGQPITFIDESLNAGVNNITIVTQGSDTIEGSLTSIVISCSGCAVGLYWTGSTYKLF